MMSASSIDGPLDSSCVCSTSVASVEKSENEVSNASTSAVPPDSTGSNAPDADEPEPRRARPADVDEDGVAERRPLADELAVLRRTRSVRSQLSPASSRAASPAATSAASTEAAKSTASALVCSTSVASASTRGCGSGDASAGVLARVHLRGAERACAARRPPPRPGRARRRPRRRATRPCASTPSPPFSSAPW